MPGSSKVDISGLIEVSTNWEICFAACRGVRLREPLREGTMNESQRRGVKLATATESYTDSNSRSNARRYSSPKRVLARSMRISRDNWKIKHQAVLEKLEQERQLSADRGRSHDQWKQKCMPCVSRLSRRWIGSTFSTIRSRSRGELFVAAHPETTLVYDAAHQGAIVLKRLFQADDRWARFIAQLAQTKSRIQQTLDMFLMSPSLRPKARYMNLASLLRWSRRILELLACGTAGGAVTARTKTRYGWMEDYRAVLSE